MPDIFVANKNLPPTLRQLVEFAFTALLSTTNCQSLWQSLPKRESRQLLNKWIDAWTIDINPDVTVGFVISWATDQTNSFTKLFPQLNLNFLRGMRLVLPALDGWIFILTKGGQRPINGEIVEPNLPRLKGHRIFACHFSCLLLPSL